MQKKEKILVGMSGGVDSSASVKILRNLGYDPVGVYLVMHDAAQSGSGDVKKSADELEVRLYIKDMRDEFRSVVVRDFTDNYAAGRTPSPCILCNPSVKFKGLCSLADELGIEKVATGHYAKAIKTANGRYTIEKAKSIKKDQSYMLCRLPQKILSRTVFPLADYEKDNIREMARENNLSSADRKDSQDICFIPDGDYVKFIKENSNISSPPGEFIAPDGSICGKHRGIINYTVGQRRGLRVAYGERVCIERIDASENKIYLALSADTDKNIKTRILINDIVYLETEDIDAVKSPGAKIRYSSGEIECTLQKSADEIYVTLPGKHYPAPGQSCVVYQNSRIQFSGIITESEYIII